MVDIDFRIKCWYENGCNMKADRCEKTCHRYLQMNYLINNCGMKNASRFLKPIKPTKVDVESYKRLQNIKDNIVNYVDNGRNLYIASHNLQTGKTTWSLKILYKFFDEIWAGNGFRLRGYFLYTPEFLNKTRSFQYKETEEFKEIDKALKNVDLVIWDDITSMELSPPEQNILNMYIDQRILEGKANIFNGMFLEPSVRINSLGHKLNARLNACEQVELRGPSFTSY